MCVVTVRDALALAGAQQGDLIAILQALEDDNMGHKGEEDASGLFTKLNPAILAQPPYGFNIRRCNLVKKAMKYAQGCGRSVLVSLSVLVN